MTFWLEDFKNIVIALSAAGAASVACLGLNSWKEQRFWEIDYKLAHNLLTGLFDYRDAVKNARNPAIFHYEMPQPPEDRAASMTPEQINFYGIREAYIKRTEKIEDVRKKLYVDFNEAKAIWGPEVSDKFDALFSLQKELLGEIGLYLEVMNPDLTDKLRQEYEDIISQGRRIMYDYDSDDDPFTVDFDIAHGQLESELRKHLGRR